MRPEVGMVERLTPDFDPRATLQGLDAPLDADAPLRNENPDMEISRREGPLPRVADCIRTGRGETRRRAGRQHGTGPPQVSRERTRSPQNITDARACSGCARRWPQLPDIDPGRTDRVDHGSRGHRLAH